MPTRATPTQEPNTSKTTATQLRAHNNSVPSKLRRLQLIKDIEGCRTGQWCTMLYDGKIYPDIMRRVMGVTKDTVVVQCVSIVGQNRFRWPLKDDTAVYELELTLCKHSAMSDRCDGILCCASVCSCETEHVVGSKGCRSFPLTYSGAILTEDYEH